MSWMGAFSPDGRLLATAGDNAIAQLWDVATGSQLADLRGSTQPVPFRSKDTEIVEREVRVLAFSPDGRRLVTAAGAGQAWLWDVATFAEVAPLRGGGGWIRTAAFSPDGTRILTACADGALRVWNAADGRPLAVLRGHVGDVVAAA